MADTAQTRSGECRSGHVARADTGRLLRAKTAAISGATAQSVAAFWKLPLAVSVSENAIGPAADANTPKNVMAP